MYKIPKRATPPELLGDDHLTAGTGLHALHGVDLLDTEVTQTRQEIRHCLKTRFRQLTQSGHFSLQEIIIEHAHTYIHVILYLTFGKMYI